MLRALILAFLLVVPSASVAQFERRERFNIPVLRVTETTFEVIEADFAGPSQIWCAAGIFASKRLGLNRGSLWVATPRGPSVTTPGRKGVVFSTVPVPGEFSSVTRSTRRVGLTFSIGHALAICNEQRNLVRIRDRV